MTLWVSLNRGDFDTRIQKLYDFGYDSIDNYPEELLERFNINGNYEKAIAVARAFKHRYGTIALSMTGLEEQGKPVTLMDMLLDIDFDVESRKLLIRAFKYFGFKTADECCIPELIYEYLDKRHEDFAEMMNEFIEESYDFDLIRDRNGAIHEELAKYFFNPTRIGAWLEANPDKNIEEYMV